MLTCWVRPFNAISLSNQAHTELILSGPCQPLAMATLLCENGFSLHKIRPPPPPFPHLSRPPPPPPSLPCLSWVGLWMGTRGWTKIFSPKFRTIWIFAKSNSSLLVKIKIIYANFFHENAKSNSFAPTPIEAWQCLTRRRWMNLSIVLCRKEAHRPIGRTLPPYRQLYSLQYLS